MSSHLRGRPISPHRGVQRSTELRAQSEFGGKRWISSFRNYLVLRSFRNYLVLRSGFDLRAANRVGVERVQST